MSVIWRRKTRY